MTPGVATDASVVGGSCVDASGAGMPVAHASIVVPPGAGASVADTAAVETVETYDDPLWTLGPDRTIEVGHARVQKHGERAAGDTVRQRRLPEEERVIVVLSDGLGSGVKAGVLSSLTATMALEYAASDIEPARVGGIIMRTLPVCSVRKIRYATFTALNVRASGVCDVVNFDNPGPFLVDHRGCREVRLTGTVAAGASIAPDAGVTGHGVPSAEGASGVQVGTTAGATASVGRERPPTDAPTTREVQTFSGRVEVALGQYLVTTSDGVTQSGMGTARFPLGWGSGGLQEFLAETVRDHPGLSARMWRNGWSIAPGRTTAGIPKTTSPAPWCICVARGGFSWQRAPPSTPNGTPK